MTRGTRRKRRSQKQRKPSTLHKGRKGRPAARRGAKKKGTDPCFEKRELSYIQKNPRRVYFAISQDNLKFYNNEYTEVYTQLDPNKMCFEPGTLKNPDETYNYFYIKSLGNYHGQRESDGRLVFLYNGRRTLVPTNVDIYEMLDTPFTF
jgi:hypothetical protein